MWNPDEPPWLMPARSSTTSTATDAQASSTTSARKRTLLEPRDCDERPDPPGIPGATKRRPSLSSRRGRATSSSRHLDDPANHGEERRHPSVFEPLRTVIDATGDLGRRDTRR
jgi:hypothetical protein